MMEVAGQKEWETATRELRVDKADGQPYPRASFVDLYGGQLSIDTIDLSIDRLVRSTPCFDIRKQKIQNKKHNATFSRIRPIVEGLFRIRIRFRRILGRSA